MRPCPHVRDGDTQAASTQPVPIHQPNAVLQVWPYAPAANPKWKQGEKERHLLFTHPRSRNPLSVLNSSSSLSKRDLSHQKIIACDKMNNNSNSTPRQAIAWLKQHLRQVSPAYVGVLKTKLLFWHVFMSHQTSDYHTKAVNLQVETSRSTIQNLLFFL